MSLEWLLAVMAFAFVGSITPGPNNMMLLASGVNFGFRRTVPHMLGISVGFSVMLGLVGLGVGQVFAAAPWLYAALKWASVAYMLWLAWKIANAGPVGPQTDATSARPFTFIEAAGFQWINPKAWTLCLTSVGAYTLPSDYLWSLAGVASAFMAVNFPSIAIWVAGGVGLRGVLSDQRRIRFFNIAMALALVLSLWPVVAEIWR